MEIEIEIRKYWGGAINKYILINQGLKGSKAKTSSSNNKFVTGRWRGKGKVMMIMINSG